MNVAEVDTNNESVRLAEVDRNKGIVIGAGGGIREHAIAQDESGHVGN
jgi:hypothetical protein